MSVNMIVTGPSGRSCIPPPIRSPPYGSADALSVPNDRFRASDEGVFFELDAEVAHLDVGFGGSPGGLDRGDTPVEQLLTVIRELGHDRLREQRELLGLAGRTGLTTEVLEDRGSQ